MKPSGIRLACAITTAIVVVACAPSRSLTVNNDPRTLSSAEAQRLRQSWSPRTHRVLAQSRADAEAKLFALDAIASSLKTGAGGVAPCTELDLVAVHNDALISVRTTSATGAPVVYEPTTFSERWDIYACGRPMRWRVLDDVDSLIAFAAPVVSQCAPTTTGAACLLSKGIQRVQVTQSVPAATPTGTRDIAVISLIEETTSIPAVLGTSFGIEFDLVRPVGATPMMITWRFPAAGLRNPQTGQTHYASTSELRCRMGSQCREAWTLDHSWELVPGVWEVEVVIGGAVALKQSFTLVERVQGRASDSPKKLAN